MWTPASGPCRLRGTNSAARPATFRTPMPGRRSRSLTGRRRFQMGAVENLAVAQLPLHVAHDALPQGGHPGQVVRVCLVHDPKDLLPAFRRDEGPVLRYARPLPANLTPEDVWAATDGAAIGLPKSLRLTVPLLVHFHPTPLFAAFPHEQQRLRRRRFVSERPENVTAIGMLTVTWRRRQKNQPQSPSERDSKQPPTFDLYCLDLPTLPRCQLALHHHRRRRHHHQSKSIQRGKWHLLPVNHLQRRTESG